MVDAQYQLVQPTSQFFAAQLLTQEWSQPKDVEPLLYRAATDIKDAEGDVLVTAYALHRPDGQWSLLLINKDHDHSHQVRIVFHNSEANQDASLAGQVTRITFGKEENQGHADRKKGHA